MALRHKTVTNGEMAQTLNAKVTKCGTVTSSNRTVALRAVARCSQPVTISDTPTNEYGALVE